MEQECQEKNFPSWLRGLPETLDNKITVLLKDKNSRLKTHRCLNGFISVDACQNQIQLHHTSKSPLKPNRFFITRIDVINIKDIARIAIKNQRKKTSYSLP